MSTDTRSSERNSLDAAISEWFREIRAGAEPNSVEFLTRYPEIRTELQAFLENFTIIQSRIDQHNAGETPKPDSTSSSRPVSVHSSSPQSIVTAVSLGNTDVTAGSVSSHARYRELKLFNKGGLGDLYRAYDESLNRETAVKRVNDRAASEPALLTQFRIEAEITGRLDHPGVVPVYGYGEDAEHRPFYVMRLINGRELAAAIREYHSVRSVRPNSQEARRMLLTLLEHLISACKTVAYAHDVGIIHCDIKPANIMVGQYGETFVLDWGLASTFERTKTFMKNELDLLRPKSAGDAAGNSLRGGTYGYISPEQLSSDEPISPTSDVYSLGATLYEILTGKPPFDGRDPQVREKVRNAQFPRPHQVIHSIPRNLEAICLKAMSLSPGSRYSTATLLARDLTSWMRDDELLVAPDRWYHKFFRLARRHRGIAISLGTAALAVSIVSAWMIYETDRFRFSQRIEEEKRRYIEDQNAIVEKTLDTSLKTLEDLCRPLANGETHNLSVLEPAMNRINDFAVDYLQDYENVPGMALHTGRVYQLRATVARVLGEDTNDVLKYFHQAEETYEKQLDSDKPAASKNELQRRLVDVKLNKSLVHLQREEYVLAEGLLKQARDMAETLHQINRNDALLERDQAEIFHLLGQVYLSREADDQDYKRALVESESSFDESVHILKRLMLREKSQIDKSHLERDLARSYGYLGDLHLAQGYVSKAERRYNDSQDLRRKLYESNSQDEEFRFQYARGLGNFGMLERSYGGDLELAVKQLEKTVQLQMELTREFPRIRIYASDLAYYQNCLAEVLTWQSLDHPETAAQYLARARSAVTIAEQQVQNDPNSKDDFAWCLVTRASIALVNKDENEAKTLARRAEDLMLRSDGSIKRSRSKQVILAIAASLQGNVETAYQALKEAVERGENTPVRFEKLRGSGLKNLDEDPQYGPLYRQLCQKVREAIKE
ncbi:protein kinase domain-containing protein [Schlesneria sp. DSM 10557]|uniref:serine/threonine-protein kinase n=2 Tax=unclassified Schlesneria TaxID=2762017 RepID=UPI0035A167AC